MEKNNTSKLFICVYKLKNKKLFNYGEWYCIINSEMYLRLQGEIH